MDAMADRQQVIVVGAARPGSRSAISSPVRAAISRSWKQPPSRRPLGGALGLAAAVHARALRQPSRARLPGRPGPVPGSGRGRRLSERLRPTSICRSSWTAGSARSAATTDGYVVELDDRHTRPTRSWSPPARSRCRSCRRSRSGSVRRSCSSTAPPTGARRRSPKAACWWSVAATPASRSPRSWRRSREVAPVDRVAPDAAAAAHPRPRPVLVPRQDGADPQDDGIADRPADVGRRTP